MLSEATRIYQLLTSSFNKEKFISLKGGSSG